MSVSLLAEKYNKFQQDVGQGTHGGGDLSVFEEVVNTLFSSQFKKVANGSELAGDRAQLLPQLKAVKDFAGNWQVDSQLVIPSQDNTKCTIRYFLNSEKAGRFDVIAILTSSNGQIDRVDEVFYQKTD